MEIKEFIVRTAVVLQQSGYLTDGETAVPGVQALLVARSPRRQRLGFARVEDHFLFIDWGNAAFGRLDRLVEIYRHFSSFANQRFPLPHSLRLQIPNLALVAISPVPFPDDVIHFARSTYLNPWYGGETGQVVLVDLEQKQLVFHRPPMRRQQGAYPLAHAVQVLQAACQRALEQ